MTKILKRMIDIAICAMLLLASVSFVAGTFIIVSSPHRQMKALREENEKLKQELRALRPISARVETVENLVETLQRTALTEADKLTLLTTIGGKIK